MIPSIETTERLLNACEERFNELIARGCDPDVALDRVWDCYDVAFNASGKTHCYDSRDRLFESKLRGIVKEGCNNEIV